MRNTSVANRSPLFLSLLLIATPVSFALSIYPPDAAHLLLGASITLSYSSVSSVSVTYFITLRVLPSTKRRLLFRLHLEVPGSLFVVNLIVIISFDRFVVSFVESGLRTLTNWSF